MQSSVWLSEITMRRAIEGARDHDGALHTFVALFIACLQEALRHLEWALLGDNSS